jgi:DsbC/DsbD-like thiol-disulfide interchange protein
MLLNRRAIRRSGPGLRRGLVKAHARRARGAARCAAAIAVAGAFASPAAAQFGISGPAQRSAADVTRIRVLADVEAIQPGATFHAVVLFDIHPTWHLYWKNPGAGAAPPDVAVEAPEGFAVGETHWPRPKVLGSPVGDMYTYDGQFALFVPITAERGDLGESAQFTLDIRWAVCDEDICLLGRAERSLSLPVASAPSALTQGNPVVARHRERLPVLIEPGDADRGSEPSAQFDGRTLRITGPARGHSRITFLPHMAEGVTYDTPAISVDGDRFVVEVHVGIERAAGSRARTVGGLVMLGEKRDDPSYETSIALAGSPEESQ